MTPSDHERMVLSLHPDDKWRLKMIAAREGVTASLWVALKVRAAFTDRTAVDPSIHGEHGDVR